jgi:hypothetical protein
MGRPTSHLFGISMNAVRVGRSVDRTDEGDVATRIKAI